MNPSQSAPATHSDTQTPTTPYPLVWVVLATVFWLSCTAWLRPLALPDEGRYVQVALEMLRSGDWLSMPLNGIPFFHKPPLFYWITAASVGLFGQHEWAVRLAPLLSSSLAAIGLYLFCLRWMSLRFAHYALLTLLVQPLFFGAAQYANMDMLVAGCISVTTLLLAHCCLAMAANQAYRPALIWAYAFAALGFLSKGLIGIVLPAGTVVVWLLLSRRFKCVFKLFSLPGFLLLISMIAAWLLLMESRNPGFTHYFIVEQHFHRFLAKSFNNVQPWWFYLAALAALSLPWLPALVRGLVIAAKSWQGLVPNAAGHAEPCGGQEKSVFLLMLVWLVLVTVFFSKPTSKLIGYILPVMLPLAFLFTYGLFASVRPLAKAVRYWRISAGLSLIVCVLMLVQFTLKPQHSNHGVGKVLLEQRQAAEPVYMLHYYFYDLPFYAKLSSPVGIVDDWQDPAIMQNDNWKKVFLEGARFAPTLAQPLLIPNQDFAARLCKSRVNWLVLQSGDVSFYPWLGKAQKVHTYDDTELWRIASDDPALGQALNCR